MRTEFERALKRATGRDIETIRADLLPDRTEADMNAVPPDTISRYPYPTHREVMEDFNEAFGYALNK
tara:strand:- start:1323 stop:1523 length:201 start_codon:yes stop_codon:yes gene_type:complete